MGTPVSHTNPQTQFDDDMVVLPVSWICEYIETMQQVVDTPLQLQPTTYGISVANLAKRTDDDMLYPPEQKSSHKEVDFNKVYIHRQTGALKTFEQFSQSSNRRKLYIMEDYQYHNLPPTEYFLCLYGDNKLVRRSADPHPAP